MLSKLPLKAPSLPIPTPSLPSLPRAPTLPSLPLKVPQLPSPTAIITAPIKAPIAFVTSILENEKESNLPEDSDGLDSEVIDPTTLPDSIIALEKFRSALDLEAHIILDPLIRECLGFVAKWKLTTTVSDSNVVFSLGMALPRSMYARRVADSLENLSNLVWQHAPAEAIPIWQECMRLYQCLAIVEPTPFRLRYARSAYKVRRYSEISGLIKTTSPTNMESVTGGPSRQLAAEEHRPAPPKRSSSLFVHLDVIPILTFSVPQFCKDITEGTFNEGSAVIRVLKRRKAQSGLRHEFLIIQCDSEKSGEFHIRIDRSASQSGGLSFGSLLSLFPAKDSITIAKTEKQLIDYAHTDSIEKMIVTFPKNDNQRYGPRVKDLVAILSVIEKISPTYSLINENCYFLASILEEALMDMFDGVAAEPVGVRWSEEKAPKAREDVLSRLYWGS
ncbi:hypothetical protein DL93DRAFT_2225770 [Clavulina sp. PMI_390]|nr:hypothetical protein DL93DRAFT_2225770 [Clavulina sp. PMI_390]